MNIFDILGPVMVGPSSSHTAGAVKIGLVTRKLLGETPKDALIYLHGSFSATGVGHGTDRALIAGILGMHTDDERIPESFEIAKKENLTFSFEHHEIQDAHPNTAVLFLEGESGKKLKVQASSIGGGRIMINKIDDIVVNFSGEKPTLIVYNKDQPGLVATVSVMLATLHVNIASMRLFRDERGGDAVMIIETDQCIDEDTLKSMEFVKGIGKVTYINVEEL